MVVLLPMNQQVVSSMLRRSSLFAKYYLTHEKEYFFRHVQGVWPKHRTPSSSTQGGTRYL
jgi:hypothetical protein